MTEQRQHLAEISQIILSKESSPGALHQACFNLKLLLGNLASQVPLEQGTTEGTQTNSGLAISAEWAIKCIEDIFRTQAFCQGLYQAVLDKIAENPNKKIHVLYAGSGPFATLMLPLTTQISSEQVSFTLIEINDQSSQIVTSVLDALELNDYVAKIENSDALDYEIAVPDQFDIIVCEAMQAGLKNEPQVAICYNLMNQLDDNTVMIPQEVALHLYLVNDELRSKYKLGITTDELYYNDLGPAFVLNKETIKEHSELFKQEYPEVEFPESQIELPKGAQRRYDSVMLNTNIQIYKDTILGTDDSGLTVLHLAISFKDSMLRFKTLGAQYISDRKPGLEFRVIN
ncbi:MAG: hypothetical protein ABJM06_00735 [Gilvibacter sp.]